MGSENFNIPEHILQSFDDIRRNGCLPEKSKRLYYNAFNKYMRWKMDNKIGPDCHSEAVVGAYIKFMSSTVVPTSLWTILSQIKSVIFVEKDEVVPVLTINKFIQRICVGYVPKQAKVLEKKELSNFLLNECDETYLIEKVILCVPPSS